MIDTRRKPYSWGRETNAEGVVTYYFWCHRKRCTKKLVFDVDSKTGQIYYPYYTIIVQLDDDTKYAFCSAHCASLFLSSYTRE